MRVSIKSSIAIIFLFLAFAGCKKTEEPKPVNEVVYEDWRILPDSIIKYGYRDIVSTEYRNGILYRLSG